MADFATAPEDAAIAAFPSIAVALRQGDAAARDSAAAQLRDLVTKAPADAAAAVCVAVAKSDDVVDAAFVQALGRADLSDAAQHALVTAMMTILRHGDANDASTALMRASPVYLPALLRIIAQELPVSTCRFEAIRSIVRFVYGKHGNTNVLLLPTGLPRVLSRVVDSDLDTDNRTCAMTCLVNIAMLTHGRSLVLVDNEIIACALRVVQEQGTEMTSWSISAKFGCPLMNGAVCFLQSASASAAGACMLRLMDVHTALLPISSLPDDEQHTANCALMCIINVLGNQETHTKGQDSPIMLIRPDVVGVVLADFENLLDASRRHLSGNMVSSIVRACLALSESDSNKPLLRGSNLLRLTADALRLYASNALRLTVQRSNGMLDDFGGGGSDPECAQLCVELLLQLSFCFPEQREWRSAVEQQCADLRQTLLVVKDLPPDRSLDMHTMLSVRHLLASLDQPAPSHVAPASPTAAAARRHAMVSYCWGAKKELVVALAAGLRAKGVDVWRDEEGSQCVPAMSGSTDDCMAAAIEHSHTIIVCVSRAYKASANCRMEAKYANDMHKRGKVNLVFVMMEQDYTTRSSPEYVDGWLGLMIGDQLWHGLWADDQVAAVAAAMHAAAIVSSVASSSAATHLPARPAAPTPPPAALSVLPPPVQPPQPPATSSPFVPSLKRPADPLTPSAKSTRMLPPASSPAAAAPDAAALPAASPRSQLLSSSFAQAQSPRALADGGDDSFASLAAAFECLQDANKARDGAALADLLQAVGVTCAADLAHVDDAATLSIKALLKPAAADFFLSHMKLRSLQADAHTILCFAYLEDGTKHVDPSAMPALLQQLGVTQPHELQHIDDDQLRSIAALFKPVAKKVFVHAMEFVRRGW